MKRFKLPGMAMQRDNPPVFAPVDAHLRSPRQRPSVAHAWRTLFQRRHADEIIRNRQLLTPMFDSGFERVISLHLARMAWRFKQWPKTMLGAVCSAALAASLPLFFEGFTLLAAPHYALHTLRAITWLAALAFLDTLGMLGAWRGWDLWVKAAPSIEDLITGCAGLDQVAHWYNRTLSRARQYWVSAAAALVGCVYLSLVRQAISSRLEIGPISYVAVGWTSAIGANLIYWLIVNPTLIRRILNLKKLNVIWHSPASTPAIAMLSGGFAFTTFATLGASLTTEFLAFHVAHYGKSEALTAATIFVPVMAGILTLVVGLLPHWWLYRVVREARRDSLAVLWRLAVTRPPASIRAVDKTHGLVDLYRLVESSPGLPFSTAAMVQYAAAVLGSLVAYFLARLALSDRLPFILC